MMLIYARHAPFVISILTNSAINSQPGLHGTIITDTVSVSNPVTQFQRNPQR